tara:strand:+ start:225 stop:2753 length:2529 start_codon:yes stop_codon:yes gene_type:complete
MSILPASGVGDVSTGFYNGVIDQSLRFEDGDSSYLLRTPSSAGNSKTFTISMWVKRANIDITSVLINVFVSASPNNQGLLRFTSNQLQFTNFSGEYDIQTNRVFRDTSNFFHVLIRVDTTQSTASERIKIYINGTLQTSLATSTYPTQNLDLEWNTTNKHLIGARTDNSTPTPIQRFDGYLAEINLRDGEALGPESFGETKNGVWIAKKYTGSYGTNGFRLTFADSSSLGDDTSGNGNDFTSSGLASTDVVLDSPENNFCTSNPLDPAETTSVTLSEGNLKNTGSTTSYSGAVGSSFTVTSGKWYWEARINVERVAGTNVYPFIGCAVDFDNEIHKNNNSNIPSIASGVDGWSWEADGDVKLIGTGSRAVTSVSNPSAGDILGFAMDLDNGTVHFYLNNTAQNSGNAVITGITGLANCPMAGVYATGSATMNFGQDSSFAGEETAQGNTDGNGIGDFYYAPPSGYLALCSSNLPDVTIGPDSDTQADDHHTSVLYTANSQTAQTITGVGMQADWLWFKQRSRADSHSLFDTSRGIDKPFRLPVVDAEFDNANLVTAVGADGFTLGTDPYAWVNYQSDTMVAWLWKANGGTTTTNNAGSNGADIASTFQANTTAGFSIVTFTGNGDDSSNLVAHGLGKKPAWYLVKDRDSNGAGYFMVYHQAMPDRGGTSRASADNLFLNLNNLANSQGFGSSDDNTTALFEPAVTTYNNVNGNDYVAYVFAEIEGYSKFGSFVGNNLLDGPYVYLGFRPAWLMAKRADVASDWFILDNKRSPVNVVGGGGVGQLAANQSYAESSLSTYAIVDFLSNGFKMRSDMNQGYWNASGGTYVYMAFAEQPFKFSNAR